MKLNADLVRGILVSIEELPYTGGFHDISIEGHTDDEIIVPRDDSGRGGIGSRPWTYPR